jgi:hypothetical protein
VISEVTYHLIAHTLIIQFRDTFTKHFNPHQFGVTTCGGCEIMVHNIRTMLDLHPDWVVLKVDFVTSSILCHDQPFFRSYDLHSIIWINSFHLFDDFTHTHPHYIFFKFFDMGSHNHFVKVKYMIGGTIGRNVVCFSSPSCSSPYSSNPPYLCFCLFGA